MRSWSLPSEPPEDDALSTVSSGGGARSVGDVSEGGLNGSNWAPLGEGRASKRRPV